MFTRAFTREAVEMRLVGYIGVDSGQVMVADPCYLPEFTNDDLPMSRDNDSDPSGKPTLPSYPFSYVGACHATLSKDGAGVLDKGMAVASSTAYGDGRYAVYQLITEDGTIGGLFVDFIGHDEDEDEESDDDDN